MNELNMKRTIVGILKLHHTKRSRYCGEYLMAPLGLKDFRVSFFFFFFHLRLQQPFSSQHFKAETDS